MKGTPFAYWSSDSLRTIEQRLPHYEPFVGSVKVGVQTDDDFRFVRAWWEVACQPVADSSLRRWVPFLKGDSASSFHDDIVAVLNWLDEGRELKQFVTQVLEGGHWSRHIFNSEFYFRAGISWALRTAKFSPSCVPRGCIPSVSRYLAVVDKYSPLAIIGFWNSSVFDALCKLRMERHNHPKFIVGVVKTSPFPLLNREDEARLSELALNAWRCKRDLATTRSTSHSFCRPALLGSKSDTLAEITAMWNADLRSKKTSLAEIQTEIDELAFSLYGLNVEDRKTLIAQFNERASDKQETEDADVVAANCFNLVIDLLDYVLGCMFGRWDMRFVIDQSLPLHLPQPFDSLPACPPGMLIGTDGMPAASGRIVSEEWVRAQRNANVLPPEGSVTIGSIADSDYPLQVPWDGIVVDDPGHQEDIFMRTVNVFATLWGSEANDRIREVEKVLNLKESELRNWLRCDFFGKHIVSHSKTRRKAPIYWQLATHSASYSVWLYYHRFTKDTFYKVLNDFVDPKVRHEERKLTGLMQVSGTTPTSGQRKELSEQEAFVEELRAFRDEVARIAPLWNPDLNDGVIINFAPLWRLVPQHRAWQKECKDCWDKLVKGDYDWAHLAMHLWPERVVPKCSTDRSLAIAHGLEEDFWEEDQKGKWKAKQVAKAEIDRLIQERTSPSVKAALNDLLTASALTARKAKKTKSKRLT